MDVGRRSSCRNHCSLVANAESEIKKVQKEKVGHGVRGSADTKHSMIQRVLTLIMLTSITHSPQCRSAAVLTKHALFFPALLPLFFSNPVVMLIGPFN